jgi:hypothetical protein
MKNSNQDKLRNKIDLIKQAGRRDVIPPKQIHRTKIEKQASKDKKKDWRYDD